MRINISEFLSETFMFKSLKSETISKILNEIEPEIITFQAKETIYCPNEFENKIGFIVSGECAVLKMRADNVSVPYNALKPGDSFGILAVLANVNEYPTCITASKTSKVLFLSKKDTLLIIRRYPTVAMNVINFLSKKLVFLNRKLATFSSSSVEEKLASFLYQRYKTENSTIFDFNCKRSAEAINVGRASLYRAIASLQDANIITLSNKKIYISDLEGLERILK